MSKKASEDTSKKAPVESNDIDDQPVSKTSINKYDPFQLKSTIDDEIIHQLEQRNFKEYNLYTDIKILVALIACILGVISHFYPIPFPKNKPLLAACVLGYVICSSIYYSVEKYCEKDAFYISKDHQINALKDFPKIRFSSSFDTSDAMYTLNIESTSLKGAKASYEGKFKVTSFYDHYGYLHRYKVRECLDEAINKFIKTR